MSKCGEFVPGSKSMVSIARESGYSVGVLTDGSFGRLADEGVAAFGVKVVLVTLSIICILRCSYSLLDINLHKWSDI